MDTAMDTAMDTESETMTHWLFPANTKFYDVMGAFAAPQTYWPMNAKVEVGDCIYIYLAAPYKQLAYITEVTEINLELAQVLEDIRPYFLDGESPGKDGKRPKPFIRLKTLRAIELNENSPVSLRYLKEHGLKGMLMGARKLENNPDLLSYITNSLH